MRPIVLSDLANERPDFSNWVMTFRDSWRDLNMLESTILIVNMEEGLSSGHNCRGRARRPRMNLIWSRSRAGCALNIGHRDISAQYQYPREYLRGKRSIYGSKY